MSKLYLVIVVAMTLCVIGCSSEHSRNQVATSESRAILEALNARDRNSVSVALWTLQNNGISNLPSVDFDAPFYSQVQPTIKRLSDLIKALPTEKLDALDASLVQHRKFYSIQYSLGNWPDIWETMFQTGESYSFSEASSNRRIEVLTRSSQHPGEP